MQPFVSSGIPLPRPVFFKALAAIRGFVGLKQMFFLKARTKGVAIPGRSPNGKTLLETLLEHPKISSDPAFRQELLQLIRIREQVVALLLSYYSRFARSFVQSRGLHFCDPSLCLTAVVEQAARQGLDRMRPDKIGIRLDFVVSALMRYLPRLQKEQRFKSITVALRADSCGEIREDRLTASPDCGNWL